MKKFRMMAAIMLLLAGVVGAASVQASVITLTDGNSTAKIDPSSQAGMYSWKIDGNDIMNQQWFWVRTGDTGGEQSLDSIGTPTVTQYSPGIVQIEYTSRTYKVDVIYSLAGGGLKSGTADIGEQIRITNLTSSPLDLHFFQYSDFDLMGQNKDSATLNNANTIRQKNDVLTVAETVATPGPNHYSIKYFRHLLDQLSDGNPTTLSDTNDTQVGDITWAFEWDVTIEGNGTFLISKDKRVTGVPEPGILLLLGSGLIGALAIRKKFRKD